MTPGRHDDGSPSELRELAEDAIDRSDRWHLGRGDGIEQSQATALARGLLSALDALEAEKRAADVESEMLTLRYQAAEASRDQAIKERDRLAEALGKIGANAQSWHGDNDAKDRALSVIGDWTRDALAGVPGGSPEEEEHNPGGTAVAVPGSEIVKAPCLYPLADGQRCCECDTCHGSDQA